jgi:hypothetical protein
VSYQCRNALFEGKNITKIPNAFLKIPSIKKLFGGVQDNWAFLNRSVIVFSTLQIPVDNDI